MQNYFDNEATSSALHATMKPARGGKCLVTLSTYEDRKEALLNTTILDDAGTCRSKGSKINTSKQNDTLDGRDTKQDTYINIPKPPPLQMTNSNTYKTNNNTSSQTTTANNNTNNVDVSSQRLSNNNGNLYNSNDTYSRPNKMSINTTNGFSSNNNNNNNHHQTNRQTLRLGTVTIGEYSQQTLRREPGKFDFISTQKKGRESGDTTPTNEALQNELQNTLSRSNLRKSNGNGYTEHQRNCPLLQQTMDYDNNNGFTVEEMSKKLQKSSINDNNNNNRPINNATGTGVGILKNGNRNGSSNNSKSTEKSIKFG